MTDIQAVQNAGAKTVAALWDVLAHADQLLGANPDFAVKHPLEILQVLS